MGDVVLLVGSLGAIALGMLVLREVSRQRAVRRAIQEGVEEWKKAAERVAEQAIADMARGEQTVTLNLSRAPTHETGQQIQALLERPKDPQEWN